MKPHHLLGLSLLLAAAQPTPRTFTFGLWVDVAYARSGDNPKLQALVRT